MKADFLAASASVRFLEDKVTNFRKKLTECENSCQGTYLSEIHSFFYDRKNTSQYNALKYSSNAYQIN
jgi:hypothetical protein